MSDISAFPPLTAAWSRPDEERLDAMPLRVQTFIVEDSPVVLDNLIATLEEMAPVWVVGHADDERTALRELRERAPRLDLLIIDLFINGGSGLGVLRAAVDIGAPAKRVVLTNYATPSMRAKCKALGADRVFDKSKDLDELIAYCAGLKGAARCAINGP